MTVPTQQPRLVVGVGASAGGLDAFKQLLAALPGDTGMAFLLGEHLDPNHKSLLAELLAACSEMNVTDADQGVELRPNTVYIIRPDTALAVQHGRTELSMPTNHRKMDASRPLALPRATNRPTEERDGEAVAADLPAPPQRPRGTDLARQTVLEAWVPPTVIAGEGGTVLFLHGELGPYLRFPQGEKPRLEKNPCR